MVSSIDFIPEFSHILQTTLRSEFLLHCTTSSDDFLRILIASIRNLGTCPCPRCCIPLNCVYQTGMPGDRNRRTTLARVDDARRQNLVVAARRIIYEKHYQINSKAVEDLLRNESLTPNVVCLISVLPKYVILIITDLMQNAFSDRLAPMGFNIFKTLLPDEMHEIALGIWRSLFTHLLRILMAEDEALIIELDKR